ncbi:hypothetical protein [Roseomonas xinghualingensis]|uniref:hypothetical protein n=1 Tax=Roseomonas xinghualingensis TaxID=2986475 RepID=UPI0021F1FAD0|nr:hypothetical protein [Roseomonas sp. SXEYE001]MCV4209370.1 hypothetical protein [Roseomonas sp. SXEYE001]
MARTAEQVQAEIDGILRRRAAGVTEVRHADRSVKFDPAADDRVLADLRDELATLSGAPLRTRISYRRVGMRRC